MTSTSFCPNLRIKRGVTWILVLTVFISTLFVWFDINANGTSHYMSYAKKAENYVMDYVRNQQIFYQDEESTQNETESRILQLRAKIRQVCEADTSLQIENPIKKKPTSIKDEVHKLLYFPIAKVGCSFWKRVFKVLNARSHDVQLFDIPSYKAHTGKDLKEMSTHDQEAITDLLSNFTSFVFVRDPFARLFSGYIDKIFLPNILAIPHAKSYFNRYGKLNPTHRMCEHDLSFTNFSLYAAESILMNRMRDPHFQPMWFNCNPCNHKVTYIGKMETFMDDTKYILSSVGVDINDVAGTKGDDKLDEKNDKGIIEDLARRTFSHMKARKGKTCIAMKEVLYRLWTVYHIRGYISKTISLPAIKSPDTITVEEFIKLAWEAYDRDKDTPKEIKKFQRTESMLEAYSTVPFHTRQKLAEAFRMDCTVFDYDCDINSRFGKLKPVDKLIYFKHR